MRDVCIRAALNGWMVQCGCQTLVYTDADKLIQDLREYMQDPEAKEAEVVKSAVNKRLLRDIPQTAGVAPPNTAQMVAAATPTPTTMAGRGAPTATEAGQELRRR